MLGPLAAFALLVIACASLPAIASAAEPPFHELWRIDTTDELSGWVLDGVDASQAGLRLSAVPAATELASVAGRTFARGGVALGPVRDTSEPFLDLIPSWNADTPTGTWVEVRLRARFVDRWTQWYTLGIWSSESGADLRRSVRGQDDADARVLTDTLSLTAPAVGYQLALGLFTADLAESPTISLATVLASHPSETPRNVVTDRAAWGVALSVPERSQMSYPGGGEVWCSPTSTSMVMAYWSAVAGQPGLNRTVPDAASATYDPVYRGHGNWAFNTAFAARHGLVGYVTRFSSLGQIERWIEIGVPVVTSLAWRSGELANAPIGSTSGHLLVVVGFTSDGNVLVNEPAADPRRDQPVRRVYDRDQFERLWLRASAGTVYLIYPSNVAPPSEDAHGAW